MLVIIELNLGIDEFTIPLDINLFGAVDHDFADIRFIEQSLNRSKAD
jgi:hypothetical protein